ncbi:type I restriction enzyme HsdR N-terminal domain-containing protein [Trichocoleus desertorum AS-A10]|uniref:type I restriction enzyme HsdR N-terminal domain-containing protein n=1 Tax=Trichocoleus desertorum TaxID=1481672 RepID=UPI003296BB76
MFEVDPIHVVKSQIIQAGWNINEILQEPKLSIHGLRLHLDLVLLHEWYPLAVVETKPPGIFSKSFALNQAKHYAEVLGLPLAIVTDGTSYVSLNLESEDTKDWEQFPSPQEVWQWLSRPLDSNEPRLAPVAPASSSLCPKLHQALALGRALDALVAGSKRETILMVQGSGVTAVIAQLIYKLTQSDFFKRTLYISDHLEDIHFLFDSLRGDCAISIANSSQSLDLNSKVHLVTTNYLIKNSLFEGSQEKDSFYDFVITKNINFVDKILDEFNYLNTSAVIGFSNNKISFTRNFPNKPIFEHLIQDEVVDIGPPEGFETVLMGDIAQIDVGLSLRKIQYEVLEEENSLKAGQVYLLTGRDLSEKSDLNFNQVCNIPARKLEIQNFDRGKYERYFIKAGDILIPRIGQYLSKKAIVFPNSIEGNVVFADSIIRVRVDQEKAKPSDVVDFLKSDSGQKIIQRFASSLAGMSRLSVKTLTQTPIFIPRFSSAPILEELSTIATTIRQLKEDILPSLESLEKCTDSNSGEKNEIEVIACQLHQLAAELVPLPLAEKILNNYPTPIAFAYKRFQDSRFNVYEQVQRLRDVYEAASFFIYNLVLADCFRSLDPSKYFIADPGARRAYNGYSMSKRTDFVNAIIIIAKANNGIELFVPELINSPFVQCAENLQELRNSLSHTATASKSRQSKVLEDSIPFVENLLSGLEFLADYRIVRVPSFYRKNGKLNCRMEVYQGTVPVLDEKTASDDFPLEELQQAEYDHLVMLNSSGQILDLHPLYQLVEDERTQYESQICFFKQRKQKEKILEGESVQGSKIIHLEGFDEFEVLQNRILSERPNIS